MRVKVAGSSEEAALEGTTLKVYVFVARSRWAVGTRDVVHALGLSSSSVAFRHLQKLEALDLISKNESGEYVLKRKLSIRGYFWISRHLLPRLLLYASLFFVALAVELVILAIHFSVENYEFKVFFLFLTVATLAAGVLFLIEGLRSLAKLKGTHSLAIEN